MFSKHWHYLITCVSLALIIYGCTPALYKPLPEQFSSVATYNQLVKGRQLYVNSCGGCHSLYLPNHYEESVWATNLDEMQERSKINDDEKALILAYLKNAPAKAVK